MQITAREIPIDWHPGLSIYASEPFLRSVGDQSGWFGGFDPAGQLRCILPYTIVRKPFVRLARFRVETIPLGPDLAAEDEVSFLNSVLQNLRSKRVDLVLPATTNSIFRAVPTGAIAAPYGTRVIDLQQSEETLFAGLNSSHRRKVRLAEKAGVTVRNAPELASQVHALVRDTVGRSKLGFAKLESFQRMLQALGDQVRIMVAEHQGVLQAAAVYPFSNHSAYYLYGGTLPEPAPGSANLLHWEAIRLFRGLGVKQYDFVGVRINPEKGSKQEGLLAFKERFGGRLVQGYLWKYPFHRLKYLVYQMAVGQLRGGDIVDQEGFKLSRTLPEASDRVDAARLKVPAEPALGSTSRP